MADRLVHEQIRLLKFNNPRRQTGSWNFNKAAGSLMRGEQGYNLPAEIFITHAGFIQKYLHLDRLMIDRGMKDLLNRS